MGKSSRWPTRTSGEWARVKKMTRSERAWERRKKQIEELKKLGIPTKELKPFQPRGKRKTSEEIKAAEKARNVRYREQRKSYKKSREDNYHRLEISELEKSIGKQLVIPLKRVDEFPEIKKRDETVDEEEVRQFKYICKVRSFIHSNFEEQLMNQSPSSPCRLSLPILFGTPVEQLPVNEQQLVLCIVERASKKLRVEVDYPPSVRSLITEQTLGLRPYKNSIKLKAAISSQEQKERKKKKKSRSLIPPEKVSCPDCSKVFSSKKMLEAHLKCGASLNCPVCGRKFQSRVCMISHLRRSHFAAGEGKEVACLRCGEKYNEYKPFYKHFIKEHLRRLTCRHCGLAVAKPENLIHHENTHLSEKELLEQDLGLPCSTCGKIFHNKTTLKLHEATVHVAESQFLCPHCGRAYKRRDTLDCHIRTHFPEMDKWSFMERRCGSGSGRVPIVGLKQGKQTTRKNYLSALKYHVLKQFEKERSERGTVPTPTVYGVPIEEMSREEQDVAVFVAEKIAKKLGIEVEWTLALDKLRSEGVGKSARKRGRRRKFCEEMEQEASQISLCVEKEADINQADLETEEVRSNGLVSSIVKNEEEDYDCEDEFPVSSPVSVVAEDVNIEDKAKIKEMEENNDCDGFSTPVSSRLNNEGEVIIKEENDEPETQSEVEFEIKVQVNHCKTTRRVIKRKRISSSESEASTNDNPPNSGDSGDQDDPESQSDLDYEPNTKRRLMKSRAHIKPKHKTKKGIQRKKQKTSPKTISTRKKTTTKPPDEKIKSSKPESASTVRFNYHKNAYPLSLQPYISSHSSHELVVSTDLKNYADQDDFQEMLEKTSPSVGHGTFEHPHWTFVDSKLSCICPACGSPFPSVDSLFAHKKAVHPRICCNCPFCGKPLKSSNTFISHTRGTHLSPTELEARYQKEQEMVSPPPKINRLFKCGDPTCSKIIIGSNSMTIHQGTHKKDWKYACEICGRPFNLPGRMEMHKTSHLGVEEKGEWWKSYKKERLAAGRKLQWKTNRWGGKLLVENEGRSQLKNPPGQKKAGKGIYEKKNKIYGPVVCEICGKVLSKCYNLKKHKRTHHANQQAEPQLCNVCGRVCSTKASLGMHIRSHLSEEEKKERGKEPKRMRRRKTRLQQTD